MITRAFACDGEEWLAWQSGGGAYGTGSCGPGNVDAVHFARASAPELPLFEALLPADTFFGLFDEELVQTFRNARRIVGADEQGARPMRRSRSLE